MLQLLMFVGAFLAARAAEKCCPDIGCFSDDPPFNHMPLPDCQDRLQISMRVYTRANRNTGQAITRTTIPPAFRGDLPTMFVVHGWLGGEDYPFSIETKDATLNRDNYNVIIVAWSGGAGEIWYPYSASATRVVGAEIAYINRRLIERTSATKANMWCVGHSLGGHICGFAGKAGSFGRITPLDPAGPWFEGSDTTARVVKTDADFVDVVHTNTKAGLVLPLGMLTPCGHVDYYPNGGGLQPGCIFDPLNNSDVGINSKGDLTPACSHLRVLDLFVESIPASSCKFEAKQYCTNEGNIPASCFSCSSSPGGVCGVMGYEANRHSYRGLMYFETNDRIPFCKS